MKFFVCILSFCSSITFADTLLVCVGDVNRCYIAQVVASEFLYHPSVARSLNGSFSPDVKAIDVLNNWNIQETGTVGQLNDEALLKADLILTMTKKEKEQLIRSYPRFSKKISTLSECALGKNVDMASLDGKDFKTYEQSRDQIFDYEDMISVKGWRCDAPNH